MRRLYAKATAAALGVPASSISDVVAAVNDLHRILAHTPALTLGQVDTRLTAVEAVIVIPNAGPTALDISKSVSENGSVNIGINASDADGSIDFTSVAITSGPNHGTVSVDAITGVITFIPTTNFYGSDEIRYTVADNEGAASNEAVISITVNEIGAPVYDATGVVGETIIGGIVIDAAGVVGETIVGGIAIDAVGVVGETFYGGMSAPVIVPPSASETEWPPERDAQGVITNASWQSLPVATVGVPHFRKVVGSDPVGEIRAALTAAGFDYAANDFGTADVQGSFTGWAGFAVDAVGLVAYNPWGGGHADSSINGIWKNDISRLSWGIEDMPSDPYDPLYPWSTDYINNPPGGSFSQYLDENGNVLPVMPDGRFPSMHTYNGVFITGDEIITTRNGRYAYNRVTKTYNYSTWNLEGSTEQPSTNNFAFQHGNDVFGPLNQENGQFGFHKITNADSSLNIAQVPNVPAHIQFVGGHTGTLLDEHRCIMINTNHYYAIFNMQTETWEPEVLMTGRLIDFEKPVVPREPWSVHNHEMQPTVYLPTWGAEGSVLRRITRYNDAGKWFVLDLATGINTEASPTGFATEIGEWPGNKVFKVEVGGIEAIIYTCVANNVSETYVMRIA